MLHDSYSLNDLGEYEIFFLDVMFSLCFVVLALASSQMSSSGTSNDRIDDVLAQLNHISKRMDFMVTNMGKMEKQMKDVTETEEQVEMKVTKMEDAM